MCSRAEVGLPWIVSLLMEFGLSYVAVNKVEAGLFIIPVSYVRVQTPTYNA